MVPTLEVIGLIVDDMAASVEFYRRLGLTFPSGAEAEDHAEAALSGGLRLALDTAASVRGFDPEWEPPRGGGHRSGLAFRCGSPAEVDTTYQELVDAGVRGHLPPWDAVWGMRYAMLLDPDGNGVDLFADVER
ncbi:VOC family protein [soil metagenome]